MRAIETPPTEIHDLPAIGCEKVNAARDLLGCAGPAHGSERDDLGIEHHFRHRYHHFGRDIARRERVDRDAFRCPTVSYTARSIRTPRRDCND